MQEIEAAAKLLPAQGPIRAFVHHNTLHAFEDQHFLVAVKQAGAVFGCHPFLSEAEFREKYSSGQFGIEDIEAALIEDLGELDDELIASLGTRFGLRFAMLAHQVHVAPAAELEWLIAETDSLRKFRSEVSADVKQRMMQVTRRWIVGQTHNGGWRLDSLLPQEVRQVVDDLSRKPPVDWPNEFWETLTLRLLWLACEQGARLAGGFTADASKPVRHRDYLYLSSGIDLDLPVNEFLIRIVAAFLDQGFSQWTLPGREAGLYSAFVQLFEHSSWAGDPALQGLGKELSRLRQAGLDPLESITESLEILGISLEERPVFLKATLLALRGWAGMIHQVETRGDRVPLAIPEGTLLEFLAIRLVLERVACENLCRAAIGLSVPLDQVRARLMEMTERPATGPDRSRAFTLFQMAQLRGWLPEVLLRMTGRDWSKLVHEIEVFNSVERRQVFQLAFERAYRQQMLDALAAHTRKFGSPGTKLTEAPLVRPAFQIICCIDDREESLRRCLEELAPECETLGAAGFFAAPIYYRGLADAHFVPLCPILLKPNHYVQEQVAGELREAHGRRSKLRRSLGRQAHAWHIGSRSFLGGLATAFAGPLASVPLVMRVLFPAITARWMRMAGRWVAPPPETHLVLERTADRPSPDLSGLGFKVDEMADSVERLLRDIGLTSNWSRLIVICGHGSSSLNNPHESAYNCGACGGGRGGPNARAVAAMANDSRVRNVLAQRGLVLPSDTVFLGAFHNTCDDSFQFSDLARLPESHQSDFRRFQEILTVAQEMNAQERCRRFVSAPLSLSPPAAWRHVSERSEDLSQTRPEFNHATNAMCVVGRRSRTRGLYLDRRSFLVSYDPRQDNEECQILARILQAVIPVCAGINLEYYFSRVDVQGYGCGTKLPHNVTSLLGVMDGAASDLRTGLSAQMVEIHDPLRLLFVIEVRPEQFLRIMSRAPEVKRLCANSWVQVATMSPNSDQIHLLRGERFESYCPRTHPIAEVRHSADWYRGSRDNLPPAHILSGLAPGTFGR